MALVGAEFLAALTAARSRRVFLHVALEAGKRVKMPTANWTAQPGAGLFLCHCSSFS